MRHIYLEAFLVFDIFLMGVLATEAWRHWLAHRNPEKHDADHRESIHLPPAVRERMLEEAQASFEKVLKETTRDLQTDLASTAEDIKKHVEAVREAETNKELEHYKTVIAELQNQTKNDTADFDKELSKQKAELKAKLATELADEKRRLLNQIDTKLADAVTSFLMETLQHEVDLGAQSAYLTKMLEEHKADFEREVSGGQDS